MATCSPASPFHLLLPPCSLHPSPPLLWCIRIGMRTQQGSEGGVPLPGGSCGSSGSSGLSPGSDSDRGSPTGVKVDSMVDRCLGMGGGGGGSLGGTLRGVLSRYWSLESLHSTTGKFLPHTMHFCADLLPDHPIAEAYVISKSPFHTNSSL